MSVRTLSFVRSCPFFIESDILSLSSSVSADESAIVDSRIGVSHRVVDEATPLLALLGNGVSYRNIRKAARRRYISDTQLTDLLGFLNAIGGLHVQRSSASQIKSIFERGKYLTLGIIFSPFIRRLPCSKGSILVSILRATTPVLVAAPITASLVVAGNFMSAHAALLCLIWGLSLFIASLWIHEITHLAFIESSGVKSDILQSNLRIGLIHTRLAPRTEIASAILGPLAGIIFGALLAVITYSLHLPSLSVIACCIATFHFGSFLPWYGDGISIQRSIKFFGVNYGNSGNDPSGKV